MSSDWPTLLAIAETEVKTLLAELPPDLRVRTDAITFMFERRPGEALQDDGIEADTLGLFVGDAVMDTEADSGRLPPQVFLFLENICDFAGEDVPGFRKEVRKTLLHELGHYLGLDELDLESRGLE